MLHLMLGNASDAFACGEAESWFRPEMKHHFRITCPCGDDPCSVWADLRQLSAAEFHAEACRRLNVRYLIDSSKALSWLLDVRRWAGANGPDIFNIFIWKDPIELAHSFWKRGYDRLLWRTEFVKYYGRLSRIGLPLIAVNYGDLVRQPSLKLAEICRAIGMEYFEGKERFWEKTAHHLYGSPSVRRQAEAKESTIQAMVDMSPDFADQARFVEQTLGQDTEMKRLIEFLRRHDVSNVDAGPRPQRFIPRHPLPPWYYWQRAKQCYRRRFPGTLPVNRLNEKAL